MPRAVRGTMALVTTGAAGAVLLCAGLAVGPAPKANAQQGQSQTMRSVVNAAPPGAVRRLRRARCPTPYHARVQRSNYTNEDLRQARRWRFRLGGSYRRLRPPINWRQNPAGSLAFQGDLHDLRWLDVLVYAFRQTGNRRPLRQAQRIAVDWVRRNHPPSRPTTPRTWFDKVSGDRAPMLAYIARATACRRMLRNRQARLLLGSTVRHGQFLSRPRTQTWNNRGLFVSMGQALLGRQVRFLRGARRWRNRGERRFRRTVRRLTFGNEAIWLEHSTTYQFLSINAIGRFLEIPGIRVGWLSRLHERMREAAGLLTMPDRRWLQAGYAFRKEARGWANRARRQQRGLVVKPRTGLAFVNHPRTYLAFLSGFHRAEHKQSDDLSFDLYDRGRRIVADTGMYHKDPGRFVDFQDSAQAHSTLTVDGQDFPRDDGSAYESGIRATGRGGRGWFAIDATNPLTERQGVRHRRLLIYNRNYAVIIADAVRSPSARTYRRYLQLGTTIKAQQDPDGVRIWDSGFRGHIYSVTSAPGEGTELLRGSGEPMNGFIYPAFRQRERRWTVELTTQGGDVDHVTTLALNGERLARAVPIETIGPLSRFELYENGGLFRILTVSSAGDELEISVERPPPGYQPSGR